MPQASSKPPKSRYFDMQLSQVNDRARIDVENEIITHDKLPLYRYPPFFIVFISIFQLVTFLYYALLAEEPLTISGPIPFNSKLIYNPYRRYEIWRYLTYSLIHAGYGHLIFNIIVQLAVGIPLEMMHEFKPIFIIFMGGVLGGSLGNSVADPHSYLAGASSGCWALIAAHFSNLILNWQEIRTEGPCFKLLTLLLLSTTDLGLAIYERHREGVRAWRTSYAGHLAGAASGLLLGFIFLRRLNPRSSSHISSQIARCILIVLVVSSLDNSI